MCPTGLRISACLLLIVLKALCLCFLTQPCTATDVGTSEETSVSYTRNSGNSQDWHGTTLAGSQNNGADNSTNSVDVIDLCTNSIPPTFDGKQYAKIINYVNIIHRDIKLCQGHPMEFIQGKHWTQISRYNCNRIKSNEICSTYFNSVTIYLP